MQQKLFLLAITFLSSSLPSSSSTPTYNVISFGAKPDGKTDSTKSFLSAWSNACSSTSPAAVYVPTGRFLLGNVVFQGPCKNNDVSVHIYGTLLAPGDYKVLTSSGNWLLFKHVNGVSIFGGKLDAQGSALWACKKAGKNCPIGATSLGLENSKNILINGVTSINSQMFNIVINGCENIEVQGVKVSSPGMSPNTDGIHVQLSTNVTIFNTKIATGDDCVSIGPGANNLWIENVACGPGHGISIGSLGKNIKELGVRNVTVKFVTFTDTQNGVRIKSWAKGSNGFARNILFQHCVMKNVQNPIVIDQNYCPGHNCPKQESGVRINDVVYEDIHGTSATKVAIKFDCSSKYPCQGIRLENVKLMYNNESVAAALCNNAAGTVMGFVQPSSCL